MSRSARPARDNERTSPGVPDRTGRFPPSPAEREAARAAHVVTRRAIRRLDILEWVIFAMGAALSAAGGWVVAWLLSSRGGWAFRSTWIGASLLLFVVSGAIAIVKIRREERAEASRATSSDAGEGDGPGR